MEGARLAPELAVLVRRQQKRLLKRNKSRSESPDTKRGPSRGNSKRRSRSRGSKRRRQGSIPAKPQRKGSIPSTRTSETDADSSDERKPSETSNETDANISDNDVI